MTRKNYSDEFKGDAVALYRDTGGATITAIAGDLGVSEATLSAWCKAAGVPIRNGRPASAAATVTGGAETSEQELSRLRAENKALRAEQAKLGTERGILRSAAKYFAGETNW
jgi:transposase